MNGHFESKQRGEPAGHNLGPGYRVDLGEILKRDRSRLKHKQKVRAAKREARLKGLKADVAKLQLLRTPSLETKSLMTHSEPSALRRLVSRFKGLFA